MMIGLIPARTGSKRVPNKALSDMDGYPLLHYTIKVALKSNLKHVILSTNYPRAAIESIGFGPRLEYIKRPEAMCEDMSPASDYIKHIIDLKDLQPGDTICLLQPTCPIRRVVDINNAIIKYKNSLKLSLVSAYKLGFLSKLYDSQGVSMKMDKESYMYYRNSSIYIFDVGLFLKTGTIFEPEPEIFEMPQYQSVDIDTPEDFTHAELILKGGFNCVTI